MQEGERRARELEALFRSSDWRTRLDAVDALSRLGRPAVAALGRVALNDSHTVVLLTARLALRDIGRGLKGREVEGAEARALQLVGPHFEANEHHSVVSKAYQAALDGRVSEEKAGAFVRKLRRAFQKSVRRP
ncbi:MAG: hypothetical protein AB1626_00675 [Candidatus Micrarchaeota archaeon]